MKKTMLTLATAALLMSGTIFTGCDSFMQKDSSEYSAEDAKENLNEAKIEAKEEVDKVATDEEWMLFKSETEIKIKENEVRIAELKLKMQKPGETLDEMRAKKIESLEQKNRDMKLKMDNYEKNNSDWETFKREFNHDMDEFGKAFKDLTVDNKD